MAEAREAEGIHSTSSLNTSDSIVNDDTRREAGHKKMLCGCATFMGLFIVFHLLIFSVIKPQNEENLTLSDSNNDVRPYVVSNSTSFCEIGEFQIRLEIYTDRYASETSWKVEPLNDPSKILFQSESGGLKNQNLHIWEFCLPAPSEEEDDNGGYILSITDFEGDGICCMKGMGWYRIAFEGTDIAHGGDFGSQDVIALFGGSGNNII
uniref:Uncharacterized protein n=1 Tax=Proboscia inermis TaxID=420281 RepID=A0A7S0BZM8_9STRA